MSAEGGSTGIGISVGAATPTGESGIGTAVTSPMGSETSSFTPSFSISQSGEISTPAPSIADTAPLMARGESFSPDTAKSKNALALTDVIWSRKTDVAKATPLVAKDISLEQPTIRNFRISDFVTTFKNPAIETKAPAKEGHDTPSLVEPTIPVSIAEATPTPSTDALTTSEFNSVFMETGKVKETVKPTIVQEAIQDKVSENPHTVMQSLAEQYVDTHIIPFMTDKPKVQTVTSEPITEARVDIVKRNHAVVMADADFEQAVKVREALLAIGVDEATATKKSLETFDRVAKDQGYKEELKRKIQKVSDKQINTASDEVVEAMQYIDTYANGERFKSVANAAVEAFQEMIKNGDEELVIKGYEILPNANLSNYRDEVKSEPLKHTEEPDGSLSGFVETLSDIVLTPENFEEQINEAIDANNAVTFRPQWSDHATEDEVEKVFNGEEVSPVYLHIDRENSDIQA